MSTADAAEQAEPPARGTQGLAQVTFDAENRAPGPISCSAALAHWYSLELGQAAPGGAVRATLWADPASGSVFLLNQFQDRMPVQAIWCGFLGRSWATRSLVGLERSRTSTPAPIRLTCRAESERLACR